MAFVMALVAGLLLGWAWRGTRADSTTTSRFSNKEKLHQAQPRNHSLKSLNVPVGGELTLSESGLLTNLKALREWAGNEPEKALAWIQAEGLLALPAQREAVLAGLIGGGRSEDVKAAIEQVPEASLRHACRESMLVALAETDPASAFNYGNEFTLFRSAEVIRSLFGSWAVQDPAAATDAWTHLPNAAQRFEALASVASAMGQNDPQAALKWAAGLPQGRDRDLAMELAWAGWARKDPHAVIHEGRTLPPQLRRGVMQNAIAELTRRDPQAAQRLAEEETDPGMRDAMLFAVGEELAARNPELAAGVSTSMQVGTEESTLTLNTMRSWLNSDPEKAISWASGLPANRKGDALHAAFFQLADADPKTAADMLTRGDLPESLGEQTELIGRGWAEQEPQAAADWVKKLPEHRQLDAMRGVLAGAARENPEMAVELLKQQPDGKRPDLVESLAAGWAHRDPEAALRWSASLDGGEKTRATAKVLGLMAVMDPAKAAGEFAGWVQESGTEPPSGLGEGYTHPAALVVGEITRHWDPERLDEAVAWTSSIPAGGLRTEAMATVFQHWAKSSPTGLANHLQSMPAGADRDEGAYQLAVTMARADMGAATAWAASLSHPEARSAAAKFFIEAARDKSQAYEQIVSSGLLAADEIHALFK